MGTDRAEKAISPSSLLQMESNFQWHAGTCLTRISQRERKKKKTMKVFANFHGVNTPTVADFRLPTCHHYMQNWEEMPHIGFLDG